MYPVASKGGDKDHVAYCNTAFVVMYLVEVVLRCITMGGLKAFLQDRRGDQFKYQARLTFFLCVFGCVIQLPYYTMPDDKQQLFMGLSSLQLFRLFMTTKGFRQITYCIVLGVPLMQVF